MTLPDRPEDYIHRWVLQAEVWLQQACMPLRPRVAACGGGGGGATTKSVGAAADAPSRFWFLAQKGLKTYHLYTFSSS